MGDTTVLLNRGSRIALVLEDEKLLTLVRATLVQNNFNNIVDFKSADEAYEIASRQPFDFFIVSIDLADSPGVTLLQRLKHVGNYNFEPFLFVGDKLDSATVSIFLEYDVDYVLTKPVTKQKLIEKIHYINNNEQNLPEEMQIYRNAKSSYFSEMYEMAEEMALNLKHIDKYRDRIECLIANIKYKQYLTDEAKKGYEEIVRRSPQYIPAIHRLAKVLIEENKFDEAKKHLDTIVDKNPYHIIVLENAGLSNHALGHLDLAKKQMNQLSSFDKTNKIAGTIKAKISIQEGHFDGTAKELTKSHSEKEIISFLNSAGVKLAKDKDYESAIAIYTDCLNIVKKKEFKAKIHYNLAIAHKEINKMAASVNHLEKAIEIDPSFNKALHMLTKIRTSETA